MNEPGPLLPPPVGSAETFASSPVAPLPALPYTSYGAQTESKPGIITAIGVISIVVACFSALAGLMGGFWIMTVTMFSKMSALSTSSATVVTMTTGAPAAATQVSDDTQPASTDPAATTTPPGPPTLTAAQVQTAVTAAQRSVNGKLNPSQVAALTAALSSPGQTYITPGTEWSPVRMANIDPSGNASIFFTGQWVSVTSQGQLTNGGSMGMPKVQVNKIALAGAWLDEIVTVLLAIFLFVAGILTFGRSFVSRRLLLMYSVLKIPLVIAGAIAFGMVTDAFYSGISASSGGIGVGRGFSFGWAGGMAAVAIIYPIALLITLNSRGVKNYYNQG